MGLFSFIKDAGAKLFGKKKAAPKVEEPQVTQEELDSQKADALIEAINDYGLSIDSLYVAVEGDRATIAGTADSQAEKEKAILVCGNVEGIAEVDDKIKLEIPEPEATYYTVQKGDYLSKISKEVYGDAMKYNVIFEANKPMLTDPDKIYPGQVLRIPPLDA